MTTIKRSISLFLPDLRGGGAERVFLDLAIEFSKLGYEVEFVVMQEKGEFLVEAKAHFKIHSLNCPRIRHVVIPLISYLRCRQPDVMLVAMWPLTVVAPVSRFFAGGECKLLLTEHGILSRRSSAARSRWILRLSTMISYRLADHRVGVSQGVIEDMASVSLMPKNAFVKIYNPIRSFPKLIDEDCKVANSVWNANSGARLLSVGSFKSVKNHQLLIRAFSKMEDQRASLLLLGDGELRPDLEKLAVRLGVRERVIFFGFCSNPAPFYATADLLVLTSQHEGFGNVIVEALSFGTKVVSTDCQTGPREILDGGRYGELVEVDDVDGLVSAIELSLASKAESAVLKSRSEDFRSGKVAREYLRVLEND